MGVLSIIFKIIISVSLFLSQAPFSENININYSNINSLPVYTKIESSTALNISAKKIMVESDRGINYFSRSENEVQPIASITKLMTALVFLDKDLDLNQTYTIKEDDTIDGGKRHFFIGEEIKLKDVLNTALVGSDNEAAAILAKAGGYEVSEFVKLMNRKARDLGMINTNFIDPTGLNKGNVSTANEVVILFNKAWQIEEIREAISRSEYSFETLQGREKKITSTDYSLFETSPNYLGGKTGYIEEAGYSFVGNFKVADDEVVVVVLNSETKNSRFSESLELSKIVRDKYFK